MLEYLELQAVIKNDSVITDVENKNNRIYFKIDGHLFSTFSHFIYHENHPLFQHIISDLWAAKHNTAEGILEDEIRSQEINEEIDLWEKHKNALYKLIFIRAVELLATKGETVFIKYIEHHFYISEQDNNCRGLLKLLQKSK